MSESNSKPWMPLLGGTVIGAVLAGAPLGYKAMQLQDQLAATTRAADEAALNAQNTLTGVRAELHAAATKLQTELESARATAASTAHELHQQRELSAELAKPDIPLELSVRKALLDSGYVLVIRNPNPYEIAVAATIQSTGGQKMERRIVVDANYVTEIGQSQGWAFASRDVITLTMAGHKDLIYMVPLY